MIQYWTLIISFPFLYPLTAKYINIPQNIDKINKQLDDIEFIKTKKAHHYTMYTSIINKNDAIKNTGR